MHSAINASVRRLAMATLLLAAPAHAANQGANPGDERMVASGDMAKFAPSQSYAMDRPLPAATPHHVGRMHVSETTEEAAPERNPYVIACDLAAADPADPTLPKGVTGVTLPALDLDAGAQSCALAFKAFPTYARSAYNLGRVEMARGEIESGIAAMSAAANLAHPLAAMTVAQLYERGALSDRGVADALPFYELAAEAGVPEAQVALGALLTDGAPGLDPEPARGARWFRKAAAQGVTEAAFELGWAFENGLGVPRDPITAARWYNRAIDEGSINAINNLGYLYANGTGVPRDEERAVQLYRQAAELGVSAAMANLGWMLENGIGIQQDVFEAVRWYDRAAQAGEPQAMLNLGWLYLAGFDIPRDAQVALDWFKRAHAAGRTEALSYIGEVYETDSTLRDPVQAARYYVQALQAGDSWPARRGVAEWDPEMALEMQNALFEVGAYQGPFDGDMGGATRAAMDTLLARSQVGS
ncbi:MAG: SEL1-like repeat protein [Maritimibacter sp.]|nr:SEL1-like repeat protein [Maritimibacter sp.]